MSYGAALRALGLALLVGCSNDAPPTQPSRSADPPAGIEIVTAEPRLLPALHAMTANAEFAGDSSAVWTVMSVVPASDALCAAVERTDAPTLYLALDVTDTPWTTLSIVEFDPERDTEPTTLYEREGHHIGEICMFVARGSGDPFPDAPADIEINGGYRDGAQADAIRQALWDSPESFGVDRTGNVAINVQPWLSGGPTRENRECLEGVVYQGGPRSQVIISVAPVADGWMVTDVRVVDQALRENEDSAPGEC